MAAEPHAVDFRIFVEPQQGATYLQQSTMARAAESAGYSAFFRSDHYLAMNVDGHPGPTDSWVTLGGIARETSTIRLGTLVTSSTFRFPGPLAIEVAQVDNMSDGRVELGLGAGWFAEEHTAYGIPFPDVRTRFRKFEETLEIVVGLWDSTENFRYEGEFFSISDSPALPKPIQTPHPPIILGGAAKKRSAALAAKYADEYNTPFVSVDDASYVFSRIDRACEAVGRNPKALVKSSALVLCGGPSDAAVAARAAKIGRTVEDLSENGLAGSADHITDKIGRYAGIGVTRIYLQVLDMDDLDHIEWFAENVIPQMG